MTDLPVYNRKYFFLLALKVAVFILLAGAVYQQIFKERDIHELFAQISDTWANSNLLYLILVVLLMPLNWFLESFKWKMLMKEVEPISINKSIKAVLAGVTFTMFTPNRIGEYGGRFLFLKKPWNPNVWLATFSGSYAQIIATLVFGVIGAYYLLDFLLELSGKDMLFVSLLNVLAALTLFIVFVYFNSGWLIRLMNKRLFKFIFKKYRQADVQFSILTLLKSLLLSMLRYTVYALQYYILLKFLLIPLGFVEGLQFVALIFLAQTLIPSIAILELGIRSNIALFLLVNHVGMEPEILSATFLLWIINLLIPALIGYIFILLKRQKEN